MQHRKGLTRLRHIVGAPLLAVLIIALYYSGIIQPLLNRMVQVIQIPQQWLYNATQSWREGNEVPSVDELVATTTALQQRVTELVTENTQLKTVIEQSTLLQEQLAFLQEKKYTATQAYITSKTADGLTTQYILNRGTSEGISVGQAVIVNNGIIVGTISEVESTFSRMSPITNTQVKIGAVVQNQQRSPGIISGEHELSLRMDFIPQFDVVAPRDVVVTSGIDQYIPEGLIIGEVTEVLKKPGALFQQAIVSPYADSRKLSVVSVIIQ